MCSPQARPKLQRVIPGGNKMGPAAVLSSPGAGRRLGRLRVAEIARREEFERAVLPHLDAAYNLARWLARNDDDAQDITQEAFLRAFRFFGGYEGGNLRSWLLTIV